MHLFLLNFSTNLSHHRGGVATAVVVLFVHMAAQTIRILNDNWFRYWSKNKFNKSQRYYAWSQG